MDTMTIQVMILRSVDQDFYCKLSLLPEYIYAITFELAMEIVMRLTFIAAGNVATWYSGSPPFGGCGGDSGYLSYLLADGKFSPLKRYDNYIC